MAMDTIFQLKKVYIGPQEVKLIAATYLNYQYFLVKYFLVKNVFKQIYF